jgi:Prolipoprotein diacylglyceryl transferase
VRCPHVHLGDRVLPAFRVCGATGFVVGVALVCALAPQRGLSVAVVVGMALASAAGFFTLAMGTKVVTGEESLTFYHHAVMTLGASTVAAWIAGAPVVASLDLAALGLGTFLAFGRVGCLIVGCCHGRPWSRGVRYGPEHAAEGFPAYLVGVRLFPLAAVEAAGVALAVAVFSAIWLAGAAPGTVLAGLAITYACGRFVLEFARGDADRRYVAGFSEAQWSSLAVTAFIAIAAAAGGIPSNRVLLVAPVVLTAAMIAVAVARHRRPVRHDRLTHPQHVRELAVAAEHALQVWQTGGPPPGTSDLPVNHVPIGGTSLGLLVSAGVVDSDHGPAVHYAVSHSTGHLEPSAAERIVQLLLRLRHDDGTCLVVPGGHGVTHLLVCSPTMATTMTTTMTTTREAVRP